MRCPRCNWDYAPGAINKIGPFDFMVNAMPLFEHDKPRDPLLQEREKTHGSFKLNAEISQRLKTLFSEYPSYAAMSNVQREALDMIALKLSRVLSGQWDYKDHWDDIAGYAKLASEACDK